MSDFSHFRAVSKVWVCIAILLFLGYTACVALKLLKTEGGRKVSFTGQPLAKFSLFMEAFIKVIEREMAFPLLVYALGISLGAFFTPLLICGLVHMAAPVLITLAHVKENRSLRIIGKYINVGATLVCFFNILANDLRLSLL